MRTKDDLKRDLALMLKSIREKHGISKSRMADALNVDYHTYCKYENGYSVPSIVDFILAFQTLGENPLRTVLEYLYPDEYGTTSDTPIDLIRHNIVDYIDSSASPRTIRAWNYLLFGNHGSSITAQIEMMVMLDRLPMQYRYAIGNLINSMYDVTSCRGELVYGLEPNLEIFQAALSKGGEAAGRKANSYTSIVREKEER